MFEGGGGEFHHNGQNGYCDLEDLDLFPAVVNFKLFFKGIRFNDWCSRIHLEKKPMQPQLEVKCPRAELVAG